MAPPGPVVPDDSALARLAESSMESPSLQVAAARVSQALAAWAPASPTICLLHGANETALHGRAAGRLSAPGLRAILGRFAARSARSVALSQLVWDTDLDPAPDVPWSLETCVERPILAGGAVCGLLLAVPAPSGTAVRLARLLERTARWLGPVMAGFERIRAEARWDPVTALYNRLFFDECLMREFALARRHRLPLSLVLADVDSFKRVNDRYGHPAGDRALREVGAAIRTAIRAADIVCRYGGDEFAAVLPHAGEDGAGASAVRIAEAVRQLPVQVGRDVIHLEVSVGAATYAPPADEDPASLILRADADLYQRRAARPVRYSLPD